jgi:predicted glycoside hydrolase/deacetylase ChbG (UPF0249 family)
MTRHLIINADGYGFTAGITRAIEECVAFGTVKSLSANVNFPEAERLVALVERYPEISVGCHLNPVVGRPVLPPSQVGSLLNEEGEFLYKDFARAMRRGRIDRKELRLELLAQIEKARQLAGAAFSHVDFHMGLHRLPEVYPLFLEAAKISGTGRIRTHRWFYAAEGRFPRLQRIVRMARHPTVIAKHVWNRHLRRQAQRCGLAMPDWWIVPLRNEPQVETIECLLRAVPDGFSEHVVHPGYVDDDLKKYSTLQGWRELELRMLLDSRLRVIFEQSPVRLAGYRDIPRFQ